MTSSGPALTSSRNTSSVPPQSAGSSVVPKVSSVVNAQMPAVKQVAIRPTVTVKNPNSQSKIILIRHATPGAPTKTFSIVTGGQNAVVTQSGVHNSQRMNPVNPGVVRLQQGTRTNSTLLASKAGNSVIAPPVRKTSVEQTIQVSAVVNTTMVGGFLF